MEKILVTGCAGFIGFNIVQRLLKENIEVIGIDNIGDYYDPQLKIARLEKCGIEFATPKTGAMQQSSIWKNFRFIKLDITDRDKIAELFENEKFDKICHLAAQPGVRYSLKNPYAYIDSNVSGFLNILEGSRHNTIKHLVFASSSSVYGSNSKIPFNIHDNVDKPISLYAATKKSNELMAHCYSSLYKFPATGLRFFTVYGPWGRPDMALFKFIKSINEGKAINVYNYGNMKRDFTYIDDIVEGVIRVLHRKPGGNSADTNEDLYRMYNIGCGNPVALMDFIHAIEASLGKKAQLNLLPLQKGDVYETWADTKELIRDYDFSPAISLETGVENSVKWYCDYYRNKNS